MQEIMEKLNAAFERLQGLQIQPTVTNMESLLQSLYDIRDAYNKIKGMEVTDEQRQISENG